MAEKTLVQLVENFYALGGETAFAYRRGYRRYRWSYRRVATSCFQLAREFAGRGLGPGDSCILWGENCAEWVISFFACVLRGITVLPMDRAASAEFVRRVHRDVDARLCICSREQPLIDPSLPTLLFDCLPECLERHSSSAPPLPDIKSQDTVEIVFTSGTTAEPKGVVISHTNILANLESLEREIRKYLKYERIVHPLRFLNLLPLSHVFGQFLGLFIPQILGGTVLFQNTLNPSEIIKTIKKESVSVLVTVPRILDTIKGKIERDLDSEGTLDLFRNEFQAAAGRHFLKRWWRFRRIHRQFGWKFWAFISGGASLSPESEQFWSRLGFAVIQGYGLTETTSLISVNHPFRLEKESIGQILPGREVKLAPDGEILVRGESIAKSYYQARELRPVSGEEGWFHTGDIGTTDKKGNLYFKGRRKNVIVSPEGMNIYPEDLETALRAQPEVRDCVVVGLERGGNSEPCAVLLLADRNHDPEPAIRRANACLTEFQRIRRWLVWPGEDFPRTSTQKPLMQMVQEFANSSRTEGTSQPESGALAAMIAHITGRPAGNISDKTNLAGDLELSSIERVELLSALEDRFQVDLDDSLFTAASTVGDLQRMLHSPTGQQTSFRFNRWAQRGPVRTLRTVAYYLLTFPATALLALPQIRGKEHLRDIRGPLLLVSNHVTRADIVFILAAVPSRFRHRLAVAMMGEMLQQMRNPPAELPFSRKWIERVSYFLVVTLFNVFPLPQKAGFRESFAFAGESADRGYSILVFPEGARTKDGKINPFQTGIGLLAANLDVPVVPIRIDGLFELKTAGKLFARPGTVKVTIGPAVKYDRGTDPFKIARDLENRVSFLR